MPDTSKERLASIRSEFGTISGACSEGVFGAIEDLLAMVEERDGRHCQTCRWWELREGWQEGEVVVRVGDCALARSREGLPDSPQALFVALDDEEYSARLQTQAEFGCVQWAANDCDCQETVTVVKIPTGVALDLRCGRCGEPLPKSLPQETHP